MKNKQITINGIVYPFRLTIGAMVRYKQITGRDFSEFKGDMEGLGVIIQCGIQSACKAEGVPAPPFEGDGLLDYIGLDEATDLLGLKADDGVGEPRTGDAASTN